MRKAVGMMLLMVGASAFAMGAQVTPEIDATSAGSAIALVSGVLLVYRGRRK